MRQQVEELEVVVQLQYLEEPEVAVEPQPVEEVPEAEEMAEQRVAEQFGELQQY